MRKAVIVEHKIITLVVGLIVALSIVSYIQSLRLKLEQAEHQVYILEESLKLDEKKIKPIIEYKEKKIEVIKKIPVYIDNTDTCEGLKNEIEATKNIINNF